MADEPGNDGAAEPQRYPGGHITEEDEARIEERRHLVETLLLARTSYRRMIPLLRAELGYAVSVGTIASDVAFIREQHKRRVMDSPFGEHVAEQMAYYDAILRTVVPRALQGNGRSIDQMLAVLDRRARLIGMDQPDRVLVAALHDQDDAAPTVIDVEARDARTARIMAILDEAGVLSHGTNDGERLALDGPDSAGAEAS